MKRIIAACSVSALLIGGVPFAVLAESETKIEESGGKYKETYTGEDGTKTEYEVDRKDGSSVYKSSNGTVVKEQTKDGTYKQEYKDKDCEQSTQKDLATGDTKVIAKGDCARANQP
jgi:hypothetical protein